MTDVERWPEEEIFLKELGMHGSGDVIAYSPEVIGPLGPRSLPCRRHGQNASSVSVSFGSVSVFSFH